MFILILGFPGGSVVKNPPAKCKRCRRHGFNPWVGKIPEGGSGKPLHYCFLKNPMDRGAWQATVYGVAKSHTGMNSYSHALVRNISLYHLQSGVLVFFLLLELPCLVGISINFTEWRRDSGGVSSAVCMTLKFVDLLPKCKAKIL